MAALDFVLPEVLEATEPPEARGLARDEVRLLVASRSALLDGSLQDLPGFLDPGDPLVVNTSATLPAAVPANGGALLVHLGTQLPGGLWLVELRVPSGAGSLPFFEGAPGQRLTLPAGGAVDLFVPYPAENQQAFPRLWYAAVRLPGGPLGYLAAHGRPIRYGYAAHAWTLPYPEPYRVPLARVNRVNATRGAGRRVIAVGTTVARALETLADEAGRAHPGSGWTDLVITPDRDGHPNGLPLARVRRSPPHPRVSPTAGCRAGRWNSDARSAPAPLTPH